MSLENREDDQSVLHQEEEIAKAAPAPKLKLTADQISLSALEMPTDLSVAAVQKVLTGISIDKFPKAAFCQSLLGLALTFKTIWRKVADQMDESFCIIPDALVPYAPASLLSQTTFVPWITREGVIGCWPLKAPPPGRPESSWLSSAKLLLEAADGQWIQKHVDQGAKRYHYNVGAGIQTEPAWPPNFDKEEFFRVGLAKYVIDDGDDPILRQLRGEE